MQSKTQTAPKNRKLKFLRSVLKRKQCGYIACAEVTCLLLLLGFGLGAYFWYDYLVELRLVVERENAVIKKYGNYSTFAHCQYNENPPFKTDFCFNRYGRVGFAYRYHNLMDPETREEKCLDMYEQVYCHDDLIAKNDFFGKPPEDADLKTKCPGLGGISTSNTTDKHQYDRVIIMNPQRLKDRFESTDDFYRSVHAGELFIRCPLCRRKGDPFMSNGTCYDNIITEEVGWPWFVEKCRDVEEVYKVLCPNETITTTAIPASSVTPKSDL